VGGRSPGRADLTPAQNFSGGEFSGAGGIFAGQNFSRGGKGPWEGFPASQGEQKQQPRNVSDPADRVAREGKAGRPAGNVGLSALKQLSEAP
jgi:hypothetical protein